MSDISLTNKNKEFVIYPAIDIIDGKCVRLSQGDYDKVKIYSDNPVDIAKSFAQAGAKWIHIVDLDAAKSGIPKNHEIISKIALESGLNVQTGGGIRNINTLDKLLDSNIKRAVIGTSAIKDRAFTQAAIKKYSNKIAIGIDSKNGKVAVDGWTKSSDITDVEFAIIMESIGAQTIIFTDISKDGMLEGPQIHGLREMVNKTSLDIIASGGVSSIDDVLDAKQAGATGIIIGKAIYEGKVDLKECLQSV